MTRNYYEPGDVRIIKVELTKPGKPYSIDIRAQLVQASIFEDIEEPSMLLELIMQDSINLVQDFPIVGEEIINITFITPGREKTTRLAFNVFSIEGTAIAPSAKGSTYILKAVSEFHFYNIFNNINKTYNTSISEMVRDLISHASANFESGTLRASVEDTKGIIPLTIPRMTPFEAIDMLKQKAVSQEFSSGGAFVFFENQHGIHFKSIESLIKEGKESIDSKKFTYQPNTNSGKENKRYGFRNIINYIHLGKFDTVSKVQDGVLNTAVQSFDILTKTLNTETFKLSDVSNLFEKMDFKSRLPNTEEFISKFESFVPNKFFVTKDASRGNDYIDSTIGIKNAFSLLLNQNILRILINGDNYIAVGDLIGIELPEVSGTTERKSMDRLNSGNYLVTKLRHNLTMEEDGKPKHTISMDCIKVGYYDV